MKYILLLTGLMFVLACSTTKKVHKGPLPKRTKIEVYSALINRNIDYQWFSASVSTRLESPDENISGSMHVRMKKDSILWVAVKKFGIEAARLQVNPKEYTILYRLEGAYEQGPISQLSDILSIAASFEDAQQLIFGNVILPDSSKTVMNIDSIYYTFETKVDGLLLKYFINGYTLELEKLMMTDKMNRMAVAQYEDYRNIDGFGKVAYRRTFNFPYSEYNEDRAKIEMDLSDVEINIPKEIKFSIPNRYEKIN